MSCEVGDMGDKQSIRNICVIRRGDSPPLTAWVADILPDGNFKRIVIKPNWVHHEVSPDFPIRALVTSPEVIEAAIEACLMKYPGVEKISVGDVPLQSCDFERLLDQSGTNRLVQKYGHYRKPEITFQDWRRERFKMKCGYLVPSFEGSFGDPCGYREVVLDGRSHLEPISGRRVRFGVSDFSAEEMKSKQGVGRHRYLIAGSVLEADLIVNLPKMKTHQKAGITGALKNLVGCNGEKAYLAHYIKGRPCDGGDEFPPDTTWIVRLQARTREGVQKRSRLLFTLLRPVWLVIKRLWGIRTHGAEGNLGGRFYQAAGSWYGNDTIWRMVFDLNCIIRYAKAGGGELAGTPQRTCVSILDGLVAGEGNGPLQPLPVEAGVMIASENPFLADVVMSRLMGFDWRKIPSLNHHRDFKGEWGGFDPDDIEIRENSSCLRGVMALQPLCVFKTPPGWRGHLELNDSGDEKSKRIGFS